MSEFIPTDYLTIDQAIYRIVEQKQVDAGTTLTEEEAGEELRQLIYAGQTPWVTITEWGALIETPTHICGGEQWFEVLRSGKIRFAHGHMLSDPVSGQALILRKDLEAVLNPNGCSKEVPEQKRTEAGAPEHKKLLCWPLLHYIRRGYPRTLGRQLRHRSTIGL